ncbi:MAG: MBL fold metallo-hydrolase [Phycisphaerales bacterium]|nr:MBL fold metallo-hydrolase [Phycisphaerales bacterium]
MPDPQPVRYRVTLLRAGRLVLDAGCMLGLIPKVVWSRQVPVDDKNRMTLSHNCLLLERIDDPPAGTRLPTPKLVLVESGTGEKLDEKSRAIFGLDGRTVLSALDEVHCESQDIGAAIPTHLHFDHAGGLTRLARAGETPDWTGPAQSMGAPRGNHGVVRAFPNAQIIVQKREWQDALANTSVMTRTYFPDNLEPIRPFLRLVESPTPFPPGVTPRRDDTPIPLESRQTEVLPGVFVFLCPGHTWGQQAVRFTDERARTVVYVPDVLPSRFHVGAAYSLSYDVEPYTSMLSKSWLLAEAADHRWVLALDHEPGHAFFTVSRKGDWYELIEA